MKTTEEALEYIISHDLSFSGRPIEDNKYVYKVSSRYYNINSLGVSSNSLVEAANDFIQQLVEEMAEIKRERAEHLAVLEKILP